MFVCSLVARRAVLPALRIYLTCSAPDTGWDTAGAEAFRSALAVCFLGTVLIAETDSPPRRSITRSYFRGSSGSLLVFDVTKRSSQCISKADSATTLHPFTFDLGPAFDSVPSWLNDLRKHADPNVAIMRECVEANSRTGHLNLSSVPRRSQSWPTRQTYAMMMKPRTILTRSFQRRIS
jgi:hypothetical protein